MRMIERLFDYIEQTPLNFRRWCVSFGAILALRLFIENVLVGYSGQNLVEFTGSVIHSIILFFLTTELILLIILVYFSGQEVKKVANVLLFGSFIMIFPPIIDKILLVDSYWSFYTLDSLGNLVKRFFLFFGDNPRVGITYGTRVEVLITLLVVGIYIYVKTKNYKRSLLGFFVSYLAIFILGTLPSYLAYIIAWIEKIPFNTLNSSKIAGIFLSPLHTFALPAKNMEEAIHYKMAFILIPLLMVILFVLQYMINRGKLVSLIKNIRFPQTIFNSGLLLLGIGVGWVYFPQNFTFDIFSTLLVVTLLIAVFSAWFFSVFVNDLEDKNIDFITNTDRPLIKKLFSAEQYADYSLIFLFISLISALIVGPKFFWLIVLYHFLTWIYSSYPFRLKRFVGIASILSSLASLLFFVMGYLLLSDNQTLEHFPWRVASLLFIGYSLVIPLKDIKDIEGDKQDHVYTLPVLVGEENSRLILSAFVLGCYFYAVYALNEKLLFLPSLLCGSVSFFIINNQKIRPKTINWLVLLVASFYVMLLAAILILQLQK